MMEIRNFGTFNAATTRDMPEEQNFQHPKCGNLNSSNNLLHQNSKSIEVVAGNISLF
jgi:hypothetical protein